MTMGRYEIKLDKVRVEFPIYDLRNRSLRDMLLLNPVRQIAQTRRAVGGEIKGDTTTLEDFSVLARLGQSEE